MPAAFSDARTAATCAEGLNVASVNSATRETLSSRACSPASARQPAPKVNVGTPTVKALSLFSISAKSA